MNICFDIVEEKENAFLASAPTFHKTIDTSKLPPIKFEISVQNFPAFFSSEEKKVVTKTVEVALDNFKSIDIASIDELPYRKYLMVLREENKKRFIDEVIHHVIRPNEYVKEIKLNNFMFGTLIYDSRIESVLQGRYSCIFSIPPEKNNKKVYKGNELPNFFDLSFTSHKLQNWSDVNKRKTLFRRKIGFTKPSMEKLNKGNEVKVWVNYQDSTTHKYFAFIEGLKALTIKDGQTYKIYYLYSAEVLTRLESIYNYLAQKHPNYKTISSGWLFFDELIQFEKEAVNRKDFENKLYRRVRVEYCDGALIERIESRRENEKFWGLNKYSEIEFSENYIVTYDEELESIAQGIESRSRES